MATRGSPPRCRARRPSEHGVGAARQLDEIGLRRRGVERVQLGGRVVVEPSRVGLPDRAHVPADLPVALPDLELGWQHDVAHQGLDVDAVVHALDRAVVDEHHRVAQADELGVDDVGADDRIEMTGEQNLGPKLPDGLDRLDEGVRVAVAIAPHGDQVRDVAEQRAEHVAAEAHPFVG